MVDMLSYEIVSPERLLKSAEALQVVLPGLEGDFAVLAAHAPLMSVLRPGVIEVYEEENTVAQRFFVKAGLAQVSSDGLTILAEETIDLEGFDRSAFAQNFANMREDFADAKDDHEKARLERELSWMQVLNDLAL